MDFRTCKWEDEEEENFDPFLTHVEDFFLKFNERQFKEFLESDKQVKKIWEKRLEEKGSKKGSEKGSAKESVKVISFSHFLPHNSLLPFLSVWMKPSLPLVTGSTKLGEQVKQIKSDVHLFGHSHIDAEKAIKQTRFIQHSLGHPSERKSFWKSVKMPFLPKLLFQSVPSEFKSMQDQI